MIIRRALPEEAKKLSSLCLLSRQSNGYDDAFMARCIDELTITSENIRTDEYWVAESGDVCGCACLKVDTQSHGAEISSFFIHPDWQKKGVGRQLWEQVLASALVHGINRLELDADPQAEPFYAKLGFETVGKTPSGSIEGRFLPKMELSLSGFSKHF